MWASGIRLLTFFHIHASISLKKRCVFKFPQYGKNALFLSTPQNVKLRSKHYTIELKSSSVKIKVEVEIWGISGPKQKSAFFQIHNSIFIKKGCVFKVQQYGKNALFHLHLKCKITLQTVCNHVKFKVC